MKIKQIALLLLLIFSAQAFSQVKIEVLTGKPSRIKLKQVMPYSITAVYDVRKDTVNLGMVQLEEFGMPSKNIVLQIQPNLAMYVKAVLTKTFEENQPLLLALKIKQLVLKGTYDKHTVASGVYEFYVLKDNLYYSLGEVNAEGIGWAEDAIKESLANALKSLQGLGYERYKMMKGLEKGAILE